MKVLYHVISNLLPPAIDRQQIHKVTNTSSGRQVRINGAPIPSFLDSDYINHITQRSRLGTTCYNLPLHHAIVLVILEQSNQTIAASTQRACYPCLSKKVPKNIQIKTKNEI